MKMYARPGFASAPLYGKVFTSWPRRERSRVRNPYAYRVASEIDPRFVVNPIQLGAQFGRSSRRRVRNLRRRAGTRGITFRGESVCIENLSTVLEAEICRTAPEEPLVSPPPNSISAAADVIRRISDYSRFRFDPGTLLALRSLFERYKGGLMTNFESRDFEFLIQAISAQTIPTINEAVGRALRSGVAQTYAAHTRGACCASCAAGEPCEGG